MNISPPSLWNTQMESVLLRLYYRYKSQPNYVTEMGKLNKKAWRILRDEFRETTNRRVDSEELREKFRELLDIYHDIQWLMNIPSFKSDGKGFDEKQWEDVQTQRPSAYKLRDMLPWTHYEAMSTIVGDNAATGEFSHSVQSLINKFKDNDTPIPSTTKSNIGTPTTSLESLAKASKQIRLKSRKRKDVEAPVPSSNRFAWLRSMESYFVHLYYGFSQHGKLTETGKLKRNTWKLLRDTFNHTTGSHMEVSQLKDKLKRLKQMYADVKWLLSYENFGEDGKDLTESQWEDIREKRPEALKIRHKLPWELYELMAIIVGERICPKEIAERSFKLVPRDIDHETISLSIDIGSDSDGGGGSHTEPNSNMDGLDTYSKRRRLTSFEEGNDDQDGNGIKPQGKLGSILQMEMQRNALIESQTRTLRKLSEQNSRMTTIMERLINAYCVKNKIESLST